MSVVVLMQNYHKLYRRPRGMYFDATDKGEMVCIPLQLDAFICKSCAAHWR